MCVKYILIIDIPHISSHTFSQSSTLTDKKGKNFMYIFEELVKLTVKSDLPNHFDLKFQVNFSEVCVIKLKFWGNLKLCVLFFLIFLQADSNFHIGKSKADRNSGKECGGITHWGWFWGNLEPIPLHMGFAYGSPAQPSELHSRFTPVLFMLKA